MPVSMSLQLNIDTTILDQVPNLVCLSNPMVVTPKKSKFHDGNGWFNNATPNATVPTPRTGTASNVHSEVNRNS
ncbi:uncharacterized protein VTP21DRAFT_9897 [Calcarisporiella thermophila]|uniref:uncharacterized protein n=1 Tax=Calcarisporiella thermophila TaxID=911321 RepID=UPI003742F6A9